MEQTTLSCAEEGNRTSNQRVRAGISNGNDRCRKTQHSCSMQNTTHNQDLTSQVAVASIEKINIRRHLEDLKSLLYFSSPT
jgi:hypothetical protein